MNYIHTYTHTVISLSLYIYIYTYTHIHTIYIYIHIYAHTILLSSLSVLLYMCTHLHASNAYVRIGTSICISRQVCCPRCARSSLSRCRKRARLSRRHRDNHTATTEYTTCLQFGNVDKQGLRYRQS